MKQRIRNLDTFRAIAAIVVMIGHIELFRQNNLGQSLFGIVPSGHTAVMMFFVISGFLISFLLTKEKEKYGQIALKDFYLRRIFRIWPVYYLALLISSFLYFTPPTAKQLRMRWRYYRTFPIFRSVVGALLHKYGRLGLKICSTYSSLL